MNKLVFGLLAGGVLLALTGCLEVVVADGASRLAGFNSPLVAGVAPDPGLVYDEDEWGAEVWAEDSQWFQDEGWYQPEQYDERRCEECDAWYYEQFYGEQFDGGDWGMYWYYD